MENPGSPKSSYMKMSIEAVRARDTPRDEKIPDTRVRSGRSVVKEKCRKAAMAAYEWGVLSRIVLGDGESPLQGEGRDGST